MDLQRDGEAGALFMMLKAKVRSMSAVIEKLHSELDRLAKEALELFKEKGWDTTWVEESIRKRKEAGLK